MSQIEFKPFPKIPRINRDIVVTEKIDGTNASIYVGEDGVVMAGARTRWITMVGDNYGFARWVSENTTELRDLGPGIHYGEWWGSGIQRRYGMAGKHFSLFNVTRWDNDSDRPRCCSVVPTLYRGPFDQAQINGCVVSLSATGSVAAPGFRRPEGVIVFHEASGHLYKITCEHDDAPKSLIGPT